MMMNLEFDAAAGTFMKGLWRLFERVPGFIALNLLKTRYGRSAGDHMARRWPVRNIRIEQNYAEYWINWAEGAGVSRDTLWNTDAPHGTDGLPRWCEEVSARGIPAAGMIATNYAFEGGTGEWSAMIYSSARYRERFDPSIRVGSPRWLHLHAAYDDTHPWEALEIVCTIVGLSPLHEDVDHLRDCVKRRYLSMILVGERCIQRQWSLARLDEAPA